MVEQLGYIEQPAAIGLFKAIHTSPWKKKYPLPHTSLSAKYKPTLMNGLPSAAILHYPLSILHYHLTLSISTPSAPEKQPEMWSQELFNRLYVLLNEGGILTTYCAKGVIRRMLQAAGFTVERLPGPPGGKREILRARKLEQNQPPILIQ